MNSYFTDVVGDEDTSYLNRKFLLNWINVRKQASLNKIIENMIAGNYKPISLEMCSCGSRQKHKCVKESESGYGKMCLKGVYET